MTWCRVWAPRAKTVHVEWQGGPTELVRDARGYFEAEKRRWLMVERENLRAAFDLSPEPLELPMQTGGPVLLSSNPESRLGGAVHLAPESVLVFES